MYRWYYWASAIFLLTAMEGLGFIDRVVYGEWFGKTGDKITQAINLLLILSSLLVFARGCQKVRIGTGGGLALAAAAFLFLTTLWSIEPQTSVREAVVYLFVVLGAIGIAGTLRPDEFMKLLGSICFWCAVASLILLVVSPSNALMPPTYGSTEIAMRGIFPHKNFLGQAMATGVLATLHTMRASKRGRAANIFMLIVFIGLAGASKSASSWMAIFVFCGIDRLSGLMQKGGSARVMGGFVAAALVPILLLAVFEPDLILEMIGKDPTLTGRTEIWAYVVNAISMKPALGWGYFAFWTPNNPEAMLIANAEHWFVPQAHNGLLEMLLNIGVIGTALFILLVVRNLVLAFKCFGTPERPLAISSITACVGIIMVGVSETVLLAPTQPSTPLFFITGLMCERALQVAKRQRRLARGSNRRDPIPSSGGIRRAGYPIDSRT